MKITIHRGIDQIGGSITEIATNRTRILIDLGQNLPDREGLVCDELATCDAVGKLTRGVDAIFYTHYHGDHIGLFHLVPDDIPQFIGKVAKQVIACKCKQLSYIEGRKQQSEIEIAKLEKMGELVPGLAVNIGDIKIIPYFVSHSAYDAYMFLIVADGKKMLHTGDFRGHGYLSKRLFLTIRKLILSQGKIDFLITEGTMLSRSGEEVMSENKLQKEAVKIMTRYKNIFVMCSSTDMERLSTFYAANKQMKGRPFICDHFQKNVLEIFSESAGEHSPLFQFEQVYDFNPANIKLLDWMVNKGFCMLVRATDKFADYYRAFESQLNPGETVLIYSMWKEYVNPAGRHANGRYLNFVSMFPQVEKLHTSGHASFACLADVCRTVHPELGIIPIHSEDSASYASLPIEEKLQHRIITSSTIVDDVDIIINQKRGKANELLSI